MNHNGIFSLSFPEAKTIIVSGDIHGNFNQLVFKLCIQYQLTDTLLIVAGDCGFGFEKKEYYEQIVRRALLRRSRNLRVRRMGIRHGRGRHPALGAARPPQELLRRGVSAQKAGPRGRDGQSLL